MRKRNHAITIRIEQKEYVFCDKKGNPIQKSSISGQIERNNTKLGFQITNNHAFRKSLNSNVLIPAGFTVTERAYLLGHSVETNQRHYSFVREESLELIRDRLNALSSASAHSKSLKNVVNFQKKNPSQTQTRSPVFLAERLALTEVRPTPIRIFELKNEARFIALHDYNVFDRYAWPRFAHPRQSANPQNESSFCYSHFTDLLRAGWDSNPNVQ